MPAPPTLAYPPVPYLNPDLAIHAHHTVFLCFNTKTRAVLKSGLQQLHK